MTSYPTFFRKYNSAEPIFVKLGPIFHFDDTRWQKKIQNDSDIFDVVMTSSFFANDVISDDFDDVINVGISLIFFMRTFIVKMNNLANFYKNLNGENLFSGNFFVLFYFTRLWDNGGSTTALFEVTWHQCFFLVFFRQKFEKKYFHHISNRFLIEIQCKYETNRLTKSAVVDPPHCPISH